LKVAEVFTPALAQANRPTNANVRTDPNVISGNPSVRSEAEAAGATAFIEKTANTESLKSRLKELITPESGVSRLKPPSSTLFSSVEIGVSSVPVKPDHDRFRAALK